MQVTQQLTEPLYDEKHGMVNGRNMDFEGNAEFNCRVYELVAVCLWASPLTSCSLCFVLSKWV